MRPIPTLAAIALATLPVAAAQGSAPDAQTVWTYQVPDDVVRHYTPAAAQHAMRTGQATVQCRIVSTGELVDCKVAGETPTGLGLGEEAVWLSKYYRARTRTPDGAPTRGQTASLTIDFTPRDRVRVLGEDGKSHADGPAGLVQLYLGGHARYPWEARFKDVSGRVLLHCRAAGSGELEDCRAARETPEGLGFGQMAVLGAKRARVDRKTEDGTPIAGRIVEVPVVINPSCAELSGYEANASLCATRGGPVPDPGTQASREQAR